jgi:hypothetical protein
MKKVYLMALALAVGVMVWHLVFAAADNSVAETQVADSSYPPVAADHSSAVKSMTLNPLAFTKNVGQWDNSVLFRANMSPCQ